MHSHRKGKNQGMQNGSYKSLRIENPFDFSEIKGYMPAHLSSACGFIRHAGLVLKVSSIFRNGDLKHGPRQF
jgi:hypothetical protein